MLHYSCDVCKRPIDTQADMRHVVKIEVFQAVDDCDQSSGGDCCGGERDDDADHLEEMQDLLERLDDHDAALLDEGTVAMRFDLCDGCRQRFLRNPLGVKAGKALGFSQN